MENRLTRDQLNTQIAQLIAQRGTCGRLSVGCVIVKDNRIVCTGYNGPAINQPHCTNSTCDKDKPCTRAIHAEANAIAFAARKGISLEDCVIYCTHQPCIKCAELIIQAGITEVVYHDPFRDELGLKLLISSKIPCRQFTN